MYFYLYHFFLHHRVGHGGRGLFSSRWDLEYIIVEETDDENQLEKQTKFNVLATLDSDKEIVVYSPTSRKPSETGDAPVKEKLVDEIKPDEVEVTDESTVITTRMSEVSEEVTTKDANVEIEAEDLVATAQDEGTPLTIKDKDSKGFGFKIPSFGLPSFNGKAQVF